MSEVLSNYKLQLNESKTVTYVRPYVTTRSSLMIELSDLLSSFYEKITELEHSAGVRLIFPKRIRKKSSLSTDVINRVKSLCNDHKSGYEPVSLYIISSIFSRIVMLVESFPSHSDSNSLSEYKEVFDVLIDLAFYFYQVTPVVASSYKIGLIVMLSSQFFKLDIPEFKDSIDQLIYERCVSLLKAPLTMSPGYIENHIALEKINILIALAALGDKYSLPEDFIKNSLTKDTKLGYFEIVSLLYYIKNDSEYTEIKLELMTRIEEIFEEMTDIHIESEKAHLFLDLISCPYLVIDLRKKLMKAYMIACGLPKITNSKIEAQLVYAADHPWFVDWRRVNLFNVIEKKELKSAY